MRLLHNLKESPSKESHIASNYHPPEAVSATQERLSFDGVYTSVYENRELLKGRECLLFVTGEYIGKDNSFDTGMPREYFCSQEQLDKLVADGHILGWHTWSHPDLTKISLIEARKEMTAPFPCEDFAYPYGKFNNDLKQLAKELGYKRAWSVTQGNEDNYSLYRDYL